jgi:hypothetical protein
MITLYFHHKRKRFKNQSFSINTFQKHSYFVKKTFKFNHFYKKKSRPFIIGQLGNHDISPLVLEHAISIFLE